MPFFVGPWDDLGVGQPAFQSLGFIGFQVTLELSTRHSTLAYSGVKVGFRAWVQNLKPWLP